MLPTIENWYINDRKMQKCNTYIRPHPGTCTLVKLLVEVDLEWQEVMICYLFKSNPTQNKQLGNE